MSPNDQLKEMLAFEWLKTEHRKRVVDHRSGIVYRIALGSAVCVAVLNTLGFSNVGLWESGPDLRWIDRVCLFGWWLLLGGMVASLIGKFRVIQSSLFLDPEPIKWVPLLAGIAGSVLLAMAIREWVFKPFSGETLRDNDAWKFGPAWTLLALAYIFRR